MKITINHGFCIIIMVILTITIFAFVGVAGHTENNPMYKSDFRTGFFYGSLFVSGMFMLNDNTTIEYKSQNIRRKWRVYSS